MCIENGTFEDLCELYPDTAVKLQRLAIQRRNDFKELVKLKERTKMYRPILYTEPKDIITDPVTGKLII